MKIWFFYCITLIVVALGAYTMLPEPLASRVAIGLVGFAIVLFAILMIKSWVDDYKNSKSLPWRRG